MNGYLTAVLSTVLACVLVGAVTFLAHEHIIDGQATIAFFATLIGGGGAIAAHQVAKK